MIEKSLRPFDAMEFIEAAFLDWVLWSDSTSIDMGEEESLIYCCVQGFDRYAPSTNCSSNDIDWIRDRIDSELNPTALEWFEDDAWIMGAFSCFSLGRALAAQRNGDIRNVEFLNIDAVLTGFVMLNDEKIAAYDPRT